MYGMNRLGSSSPGKAYVNRELMRGNVISTTVHCTAVAGGIWCIEDLHYALIGLLTSSRQISGDTTWGLKFRNKRPEILLDSH